MATFLAVPWPPAYVPPAAGAAYWPRRWFAPGWFGPRWWCDGSGVPAALAADLLTALVSYLRAAPSVTAAFPSARIYDEVAPAGTALPYLVALGYLEPKPGRTADDQAVTVRLAVLTSNGLDAARAAGIAIKNAVDTPAINPAALGRSRFVWTGGRERGCLRGNSTPRRMPGLGKGGLYVYTETIEYTFGVTPSQ